MSNSRRGKRGKKRKKALPSAPMPATPTPTPKAKAKPTPESATPSPLPSLARPRIWLTRGAKLAYSMLGVAGLVVGLLTLYPRFTITPGQPVSAFEPFSAPFTVRWDGLLPLHSVTAFCSARVSRLIDTLYWELVPDQFAGRPGPDDGGFEVSRTSYQLQRQLGPMAPGDERVTNCDPGDQASHPPPRLGPATRVEIDYLIAYRPTLLPFATFHRQYAFHTIQSTFGSAPGPAAGVWVPGPVERRPVLSESAGYLREVPPKPFRRRPD